MSEKMEFEDRSDRTVPAKLVMMMEINVKSAGIPDIDELAELVTRVGDLGQSLRNAQGRNWHVESVHTDSFPPNNISEAFDQLVKMFNLVGVMSVWASTLSKIHIQMSDMIEPARSLAGISKWLGTYIHDLIVARKTSERLVDHCGECDPCREFFQKFEKDAFEWGKKNTLDTADVDEALRVVEMMRGKEGSGCN